MAADWDNTTELLERAHEGDRQAWDDLLGQLKPRLRRMVEVRMDQRLQARLDPSDVIQESLLDAHQRLGEFLRDKPMPFYLWVRFLTGRHLATMHRRHLATQKRTAARDVPLDRHGIPAASSARLAIQLFASTTSPSEAVAKMEMQAQLQGALSRLDPIDREILALRHFEHLSNAETAEVLEMNESTTSTRYLRALKELKLILEMVPGFFD